MVNIQSIILPNYYQELIRTSHFLRSRTSPNSFKRVLMLSPVKIVYDGFHP